MTAGSATAMGWAGTRCLTSEEGGGSLKRVIFHRQDGPAALIVRTQLAHMSRLQNRPGSSRKPRICRGLSFSRKSRVCPAFDFKGRSHVTCGRAPRAMGTQAGIRQGAGGIGPTFSCSVGGSSRAGRHAGADAAARPRAGGMRRVRQRVLARARPTAGLSRGVRPRVHPESAPRRADPGRVRRAWVTPFGRGDCHRGDQPCRRKCGHRPRPDVRHGSTAAPRQSGPKTTVAAADRERRIASAGLRRHGSGGRQRHDPNPHGSGPARRCLRGQRREAMDLEAAELRSHAPARAPRRRHPAKKRAGSRCFSWICARRTARCMPNRSA